MKSFCVNEFYFVTWLYVGEKSAIFDRLVLAKDSLNISTVEKLVLFKIAGFSSLNQDN